MDFTAPEDQANPEDAPEDQANPPAPEDTIEDQANPEDAPEDQANPPAPEDTIEDQANPEDAPEDQANPPAPEVTIEDQANPDDAPEDQANPPAPEDAPEATTEDQASPLAAPEYSANPQIPIDLFVSKKHGHAGGRSGGLRFTDASGNLVYRVDRQSPESTSKRLLFDASGNALICIARNHKGCWQCFKGNRSEENDLICRVERTVNAFNRTEFEIFPVSEIGEESKSEFKMRGSPFFRSCTVYRGNSILAQTSLMYKLGIQKVFVCRHRFRLTLFPGFGDHAFVVALIVIFFDGRKLWI